MATVVIPKVAIPHSNVGVNLILDAHTLGISSVLIANGDIGQYTWAANDILVIQTVSTDAVTVTYQFGPFPAITAYGGAVVNETDHFEDAFIVYMGRVGSQFVDANGKVNISADGAGVNAVVLTY